MSPAMGEVIFDVVGLVVLAVFFYVVWWVKG